MPVRFYIDPDTRQPHTYGHSVNEQEVEAALSSALEDRPGREGSRIAIGRTRAGRYLRIIYVPEATGDIFVITAYPLAGKPLAAFRRRMRRRRGRSP